MRREQEVDQQLADLWYEQTTGEMYLASARESQAEVEEHRRADGSLSGWYASVERNNERTVSTWEPRVLAAREAARPLEAEYAKAPWSRFFLVTSSDGHVHSSMSCETTYARTTWSWLPDLSGLTENEAVEEYGEKMCTICFPSAPTLPAFMRAVADREAAEVAKAAAECPGSRSYDHDSSGLMYYSPRAVCNHCHKVVSATSTGKLRAHKKEGTA